MRNEGGDGTTGLHETQGGIKQSKSVGEDKMQRKRGEKKAVPPLQLASSLIK